MSDIDTEMQDNAVEAPGKQDVKSDQEDSEPNDRRHKKNGAKNQSGDDDMVPVNEDAPESG